MGDVWWKEMQMSELKAWCNGYEVVAATSEYEARAILLAAPNCASPTDAHPMYRDADEADGDGWYVLANEKRLVDDDGRWSGETIGSVLAARGLQGHMWSLDV